MAATATPRTQSSGLMNRYAAWRAARPRTAITFVCDPQPRTIGSFVRGQSVLSGNFVFGGALVEAPDTGIFDLEMPNDAFQDDVQGFGWLDDLAAIGDGRSRQKAQDWTFTWITRHARGAGPGWTPALTGRRIIRWIDHGAFLLRGRDASQTAAFYTALGRQARFLVRRWHAAPAGLARFEAIGGLLYASTSIAGQEPQIAVAAAALDHECNLQIDMAGGLPSRNPEDLLTIFSLLSWTAQALYATGRAPLGGHRAALDRIAPVLRALRHANGALARFHGGGAGIEGRLDLALDGAQTPAGAVLPETAMGYIRLAAGRTTVVVDAALPPSADASLKAHAGPLAFELTSGRRPLIVNCGSGAAFGETWHRAGRATPSHSTLGIDGYSSSHLIPATPTGSGEILVDGPSKVGINRRKLDRGTQVVIDHDGYGASHGLTHSRNLLLTGDGRELAGEDTLAAVSDTERHRFEQVMTGTHLRGVAFAIRFHLHPDVMAALDEGTNAVTLMPKSGELWLFRHDGVATVSIEPSVYLENSLRKPRATKQIVLSGRVLDFGQQIGWTLGKAHDTPQAIRDLAFDAVPDFHDS